MPKEVCGSYKGAANARVSISNDKLDSRHSNEDYGGRYCFSPKHTVGKSYSMSVAINGSELLTRPSEEQDLDREEEEDGEEHFRGIGCGMPQPACSMLRVLPSA